MVITSHTGGQLGVYSTSSSEFARRENLISISVPARMFAYLLAQDPRLFRIFLTFDFQIELIRLVGVDGVLTHRQRGFVPPVLIDPEPILRVCTNNRLELVPACLSHLLV